MVELGESQSFLNYEFGVLAGKICQYIYVVGEVNYESIYNGVFSTGFDVDKRLIRVKSPEDAIFRVRSLRHGIIQKSFCLKMICRIISGNCRTAV